MKTKIIIAVGTFCLFLASVALVGCGRNHSSSELRVTSFKSITRRAGLYPEVFACEATVRNSAEIVTAVKDYESCEHIRIGDKAEHSGSDVWINGDLYTVEHADAAQ